MDIYSTAAQLRSDRTPFVMATVVASYPPQSVRPGAKAIVHMDGTIDGWVGGGCVRPVVLQESADALADGRPRLVRLNVGPNATGETDPTRHGDVREYPMTCQGEGGIEIYLEPVLAAPRLVLLGHTPVVQSLARLGTELGFEIVVGSAAVSADLFPTGVRVSADVGETLVGADATTWVVVGTMGAGDEEALAAAAASDAAYVGLVASRKKARHLIEYVRETGVPAERLARVKYPAGLDLGGMSAAEIALSVLAEIVQRRYGKALHVEHPAAAEQAEGAGQQRPTSPPPSAATPVSLGRGSGTRPKPAPFPIDPACGLPVDPATAKHTIVETDRTLYFCCSHCKAKYIRLQSTSNA
jgi:xanthine dehydrogenase accessory factor